MVFQHFNLWAHMTALENVIEAPTQVLGLSQAPRPVERGERYLQRVGVMPTARTPTRRTSPAASSSASPSPARWRWSPR